MFKGGLYPYQHEAKDKFLDRGSLLLAYGCGTGKTVIAIAAAEELIDSFKARTVLILCPASLKYQWRDKIWEFASSADVVVVDGDKTRRTVQITQNTDIDYMIVSYESMIYDYECISMLKPDMVVCDEVTAIKSFKALRSKRIKKLFGNVPYRLGLTATPIENRPEELYSIMQWVDPKVLGRYDLFEKAYMKRNSRGWITEYKNLDVLYDKISPAMSRKTRHDPEVRPYLPDVDEDNWMVSMDSAVLKVYKKIAADMLSHIEENPSLYGGKVDLRFGFEPGMNESEPDGKLMAMHMCMEMILDHPALIGWSAMEYEKDSPEGCAYAWYLKTSGVVDSLNDSPKLSRLKDELGVLLDDPESKVIVVSKYKHMLKILASSIQVPHVMFTGDMSAAQKAKAVEDFKHPMTKILFTSYAGGYGLDLYMADYLINYDLPWAHGTRDQINSRHVRASSDFDKVYVRNLVTEGTIEERKYRMLVRKSAISAAVLDGRGDSVEVGGDTLRSHLEEILWKDLTSGH